MIRSFAQFTPGLLLLAVGVPLLSAEADVKTSYVPYHFEPAEQWTVAGSGDIGATRFDGSKRLVVDFSRGADWVSLRPPDRALLGSVDRVRLRLNSGVRGHAVHLLLRTHFMTFRKAIGDLSGGPQEISTDGPPGPGWTWFGGENDGKLHGPVRVGEIRIESGGRKDTFDLELLDITVDGHVAADKRCVMVAQSTSASSPSTVAAEIRCLTDEPLAASLSWTLSTWDGETVGTGERTVSIPAGAQPARIAVALPEQPAGRKFLETWFRLDLPGQSVPDVQAYWLAKQPPNTDDHLRPESHFGMGLYLGRYQAGAEMDRAAKTAREAGVKWSREGFSWGRIEPEKGQYDWSFYDQLIATARRHGISVYAIISGWAPWVKAYTDEGIQDYLTFTRQLVRRYKNQIHQWEIWNEPNIFFWQGPREMYATLLKKSYAAIKEEDPTAEVLGLSTSGIDYNFIAQMLARETPFDVLTIHPYRRVLDDQIFINELKIVSDLVKRQDGTRRPVWLTEMGWSTVTPHNALKQDFASNTQRDNAKYIARTYLCSIVSGVEPRTFWYDFRNDGEEPLYFEHEMGIVRRDFEPKPGYYSYATLARVLYGLKLEGRVDAGLGVFAYRFRGDSREVYALWNPSGDGRAEIPVNAARVRLVNTIGEERELPVNGGKVAVQLNGRTPSYLMID